MKNIKVTPFLVVLVPALLVSIGIAIYYFARHNHDSKGMTAILGLIMSFFLLVVLVIERVLVKINVIPFSTLCKLEGVFLGGLVLLYLLAFLQR